MAKPFLFKFATKASEVLAGAVGLGTQTMTKTNAEGSDSDASLSLLGTQTSTATREGTDQDPGHRAFRLAQ